MAAPVQISAVLANGSQTVALPTWQHLTFTSVTGSLATINGNGDLDFGALGGNATVQVSLTVDQRTRSEIYLGYGWGGHPPVQFASHQMTSILGSETVSGGVVTIFGGVLALYTSSDNANQATVWSNGTLTFTEGEGVAFFPAFVPIVPPPVIGEGGGPPPTFPPPTPPPIGHVPPGVLVGPVITYAPVPPSVAGFPQPRYQTGSATSPTGAQLFPIFTTTFPVPTIVVDGNNFAVAAPGQNPPWTQPPPAQTASTLLISIDGYAPQLPPWLTAAMAEAPQVAYAPEPETGPPPDRAPPPTRRKRR